MRSARQRAHSIANIRNAGMLRPKRWVSIESCDRVDAVSFIPTLTRGEREHGFAVRVLPGGVKAILKAKERWRGAWFFFWTCPNPCCRDALLGRGREYLIRLPDARPDAWGCRGCLPVEHVARRYRRRSPSRANAPPLHRVAVRLARERRRQEKMLAPVVEQMCQERAEAEASERRRNNELALAVVRAVAQHGAVEVEMRQRETLPIVQLGAMVRAARRDRLARVTGG